MRNISNEKLVIDVEMNDTDFKNGINNITGGLKKIEGQSKNLGGRFNSNMKGIANSISGMMPSMENFQQGISGLGIVITSGITSFDDLNKNAKKLQLQLGLTDEQTKNFTKSVENIYNKKGGSLEEIFNTVSMVRQNFKNLSDGEVADLSEKTLSLSKTFGYGTQEILGAVKGGVSGFNTNYNTVLDSLIQIKKQGGDVNNTLMSMFTEFPNTINDGINDINIEDFTKLFITAGQKGIYDYTKLGDVLKDLQNRIHDMSYIQGIKIMGKDAEELRNQFLKNKIGVGDYLAELSKIFNKMDENKKLMVLEPVFGSPGGDIKNQLGFLGEYKDVNLKIGDGIDEINKKYSETIGLLDTIGMKMKETSLDFGKGLNEGFGSDLKKQDEDFKWRMEQGMKGLKEGTNETGKFLGGIGGVLFDTSFGDQGLFSNPFGFIKTGLSSSLEKLNPFSDNEKMSQNRGQTNIIINTGAVLDTKESIAKAVEKTNQTKKDLNIK